MPLALNLTDFATDVNLLDTLYKCELLLPALFLFIIIMTSLSVQYIAGPRYKRLTKYLRQRIQDNIEKQTDETDQENEEDMDNFKDRENFDDEETEFIDTEYIEE